MARKDVIILSTQDELYAPQSNGVHKEIFFNKECFPIVLPHWKYSFSLKILHCWICIVNHFYSYLAQII